MTKQDAYRIVYNDILNRDIRLFLGHYDAKHGNASFMHGIGTVMEFLAHEVSEKDYEDFTDLFTKNLIESKKKA